MCYILHSLTRFKFLQIFLQTFLQLKMDFREQIVCKRPIRGCIEISGCCM